VCGGFFLGKYRYQAGRDFGSCLLPYALVEIIIITFVSQPNTTRLWEDQPLHRLFSNLRQLILVALRYLTPTLTVLMVSTFFLSSSSRSCRRFFSLLHSLAEASSDPLQLVHPHPQCLSSLLVLSCLGFALKHCISDDAGLEQVDCSSHSLTHPPLTHITFGKRSKRQYDSSRRRKSSNPPSDWKSSH
jgi:hypothetical protein